jgi:hypothetical protein
MLGVPWWSWYLVGCLYGALAAVRLMEDDPARWDRLRRASPELSDRAMVAVMVVTSAVVWPVVALGQSAEVLARRRNRP